MLASNGKQVEKVFWRSYLFWFLWYYRTYFRMISFVPSLLTFLGQTAGVIEQRELSSEHVKQLSVCVFQAAFPKEIRIWFAFWHWSLHWVDCSIRANCRTQKSLPTLGLSFSQSKMKHLESVVSRAELFIRLVNEKEALINASGIIHPNLSQYEWPMTQIHDRLWMCVPEDEMVQISHPSVSDGLYFIV